MPQETKSHPSNIEDADVAPGFAHENLEGLIPSLASDEEIRAALEKAFDYRGDVTITTKDGDTVEGYVFDRGSTGPTLAEAYVRIYPKEADDRHRIPYSNIASLKFTGRDTAAGKSFDTWLKNYRAKQLAGETNIAIDPEQL